MPNQATNHAADVLLATVTEVETKAVFAALKAAYGRDPLRHYIGDKGYYDLGTICNARVWLVRSEMGTATPGGAFATISSAIDVLQPAAIIMVGIAFGLYEKKQRIGDVLVARQLMLYDLQLVGTDAAGSLVVYPRGDRITASTKLLNYFRHGALIWRPAPSAGKQPPEVHFGLLLSGDKLVDNHDFRDQLHRLEPEAIGGEMEGAGLYLASKDQSVHWIIVKAICDWADGNKSRNKAARQQLAAQNAAALTFHVLEQGGFG